MSRTIRAGIGETTAARRHPAPKTVSHSFGFGPGIDLSTNSGSSRISWTRKPSEKRSIILPDASVLVHPHTADSTLHDSRGCGGTAVSRAPMALVVLSRERNGFRAVDDRRHPVRRAPGQSGVDRLLLEVVNYWSRCEALTIAQAVDIDDRLCPRRQFRDCCDEDAATTADQKIAAARSEAIIFYERPIVCPNLE